MVIGSVDRLARWIERGLLAVGITCCLWVAATGAAAVLYQSRADLPASANTAAATQFEASDPIGRLVIPRLGLSVIVAEGDDAETLNVAVGHLPDTPLPWQEGNTALAGHRDTFFRPLRRVKAGDEIRFETANGTFHYRVTRLSVVDPEDLWVLDASPGAALTLITCYPFDFVGPAPRRFVVHAERVTG